jgi:micrococcal nuclease
MPRRTQAQQIPLQVGQTLKCRITRVVDGDTVHCGDYGSIRLLMIDSPEMSQGAAGRDARRVLLKLIPVGTPVKIELDVTARDRYGRILGYIYTADGRMVNEEMARSGYVTALVYPPNVRYVDQIRRAVSEAQAAKRGLWATDFFACSPRDYRAGRCGRPGRPGTPGRQNQSAGSS